MNLTKSALLLLVSCSLLCFSCEEEIPELTDTTSPTFNINTPSTATEYLSDQAIPVQVTISDDNKLASYKVLVRNLATDELVFIESQTTDAKQAEVNDEFTVSVAETTEFRLEIEIEDAAGNATTENQVFKILPPPGGVLNLNIKLTYQDEPLVIFERYDYEGMRLFFTRFSSFLSDITLINGSEEVLIREVDFLDLTGAHETPADAANGFDYEIGGIPAGTYSGLVFGLGVKESLNAQQPADFSPSSPLSRSGEYWASWESYIFQKTEAKLDSDGDDEFETQVALHLGANNAYRTKTLEKNIEIRTDNSTTVELTIDVYDMLVQNDQAYDLRENGQIHSLSQLPLIEQLSDNLVIAIQ
ncbi:MAG: MbnP family protein [Saprospiraceae bacterium]